jgi:hypothetical protein
MFDPVHVHSLTFSDAAGGDACVGRGGRAVGGGGSVRSRGGGEEWGVVVYCQGGETVGRDVDRGNGDIRRADVPDFDVAVDASRRLAVYPRADHGAHLPVTNSAPSPFCIVTFLIHV